MPENKPWKSKHLLAKKCAKLGYELGDRITDPKGNRVFLLRKGSEIIGCRTLKDVYAWVMSNTPPSQR